MDADTNHLHQTLMAAFKELHQNPELSNQEMETTDRLKKWLHSAGVEVLDVPLRTGLVAYIAGKNKEPVVAIRCDIDALPILEETNLPYQSENRGVMHACGHDFHMTSALGAAIWLNQHRDQLSGSVKILFQPAEEAANGAKDVLATGVLSDVEAIFGLHAAFDLKVGEVGLVEGFPTAAVDRFLIAVKGVGSHAAHPELGIDPVVVSSYMIGAFQTIISRNLDPQDSAIISVTNVHSGNTWNVCPSSAVMEGTVRTLNPAVRAMIPKRMKNMAENIALGFGASCDFSWISGPPATCNTRKWADFAKRSAAKCELTVSDYPSNLIGEDFAYFQEKIPGAFVWVGVDSPYPLHNANFIVDVRAIEKGYQYLARLAADALEMCRKKENAAG